LAKADLPDLLFEASPIDLLSLTTAQGRGSRGVRGGWKRTQEGSRKSCRTFVAWQRLNCSFRAPGMSMFLHYCEARVSRRGHCPLRTLSSVQGGRPRGV